jgi:exodeoxyribonuclease V alpha subunit
MSSVSGSVDRIVFRNSETGFCVARFRLLDVQIRGDSVTTVVGTMPSVRPGEVLRLSGEWQIHPVHGRNFRVERFEEELPTSVEGIESYLSSGAITGVGPVTAARIVARFGERSIEVIDESPESLRDVQGISAKRLQVIKDSWQQQKKIRELSIFLQSHDISVALASRIHAAYGDQATEVIKEDPYQLARDIHGVGFRTADAVAHKLGIPKNSLSRYVAGLKYTVSQATEDGHVFVPRAEVLIRAGRLLEAPTADLEPALLELLRRGEAVLDDDDVYLTPFHRAETGAVRLLTELRSTASALTLDRRFDATTAIRDAGATQGLVLAEKQVSAAEQALREKVSILTGGPGTGKTSTLRTIITALEAAGISFCLCAPTGRAAKRVAETTGRPASTIHRLLEYQPGIHMFNYDRDRQLPYDFVIVDEVSMLETLLFYHLLKAIPLEAHLLLVGDADQLPAVGPGNVLRELISSRTIPTVTLTDLFRQARGSQIVLAAHAVNHGDVPRIENATDHDLFFVGAPDEESVVNGIKLLLRERIPRKFNLDPVDDVQVISPMHAGRAGVVALNTEIQELLNPSRPGVLEVQRGGRTLRSGDKVMQIRNNYEKDVYNGDVGKVVSVRPEEQRLVVAFPNGPGSLHVDYESTELDEIVLAYAVSVHKAQGSEFPCVIMPLVTRHFMLLQRNLLYTAITRAKHLCVLVGSRKALATAVTSDRRESRNTRLASRLQQPSSAAAQLELA